MALCHNENCDCPSCVMGRLVQLASADLDPDKKPITGKEEMLVPIARVVQMIDFHQELFKSVYTIESLLRSEIEAETRGLSLSSSTIIDYLDKDVLVKLCSVRGHTLQCIADQLNETRGVLKEIDDAYDKDSIAIEAITRMHGEIHGAKK